MRRHTVGLIVVVALAFFPPHSARAFQPGQGGPGGGTGGGMGFTGSPGGGFTGQRGGGFTESLGSFSNQHFVPPLTGAVPSARGAGGSGSRLALPPDLVAALRHMRRKNAPFNPLINRRGVGWNNPFRSYHERWIEGYWSGQYADGLGWRQSGATLALAVPGDGQTRLAEAGLAGWGLLPWAYGPILYESGYLRYGNPYARRGPDRGVTEPLDFDEAQPVDPRGASATDPGASLASSAFTSARLVFMQHDYVRSLAWIDQALKLSPGDPALYQFRSLVLFATKRYDEAASALYAALAVEPGWNWTTLIDLYDTPDAYTEQLRALETFKQQHPRSAPARFVLAYHYLTAEHAAAALQQYKLVCELLPDDALSLQLSHKLDPAHRPSPNSADRAGAPPAKDGKIEGSWSARTRGGATLRVTFDAGGRFHWTISQGRIDRRIEGAWQKDGDQLTLTQDQIGGTMIGRAQWRDEHHFVFRLLGADSDDAGLSFALATN